MLTKVVALVVGQVVSKNVEARNIDPSHLRLDFCLQVRRIGAQQLLPEPEHDRLSDVLASEQPRPKRFGYVLEPHAPLKGLKRGG